MTKHIKIRLTKLCYSVNPSYSEKDLLDEVDGLRLKGMPVDYTVEGILLTDLECGKSLQLMRTKRNGVECLGRFNTSTVTFIRNKTITTRNSVYKVEYL